MVQKNIIFKQKIWKLLASYTERLLWGILEKLKADDDIEHAITQSIHILLLN